MFAFHIRIVRYDFIKIEKKKQTNQEYSQYIGDGNAYSIILEDLNLAEFRKIKWRRRRKREHRKWIRDTEKVVKDNSQTL